MDTARQAAPEIDRLVLSVNGRVGSAHGSHLMALARERGLDSLDLLPHMANFLLGGRLTPDLALLRLRYAAPDTVLGRIDELTDAGLIAPGPNGLEATAAMTPLLEALLAAQATVAGEQWGDHPDDVESASTTAARLGDTASADHSVAVVHRQLPRPDDPYLLFHQRLVTLRYIRQHDHAAAWGSHGLTASDMVAMTALWHRKPLEPGGRLDRLFEMGHAQGEPPELTASGRQLRQTIEEETNRRAQQTFDTLGDDEAAAFLAALRRLPGVID